MKGRRRPRRRLFGGGRINDVVDLRNLVAREAAALRFETIGIAKAAEGYALAPSRVQLQNKDCHFRLRLEVLWLSYLLLGENNTNLLEGNVPLYSTKTKCEVA